MEILSVEATKHRVPVTDPLTDEMRYTIMVFTRIETDDGFTGFSTVSGLSPSAVCEFVNGDAGPLVVGKNPLETEMIWYEFYRNFNRGTHSGVWSRGVSAVDVALWDIKGKYSEQPVYRLLGGSRQTVPMYITCNGGKPILDPEQLVEYIRGFVADGHDKFKIAVAGGRWPSKSKPVMTEAVDVARVRAIREAFGEDLQLMVDANCGRSLFEAVRLAKLLEPFDITWFEEPLYQNDPMLLAQLRLQTPIPIAVGQNEGHKWRHRDLVVNKAVDIVQTDVQRVGGFTEGLKVAHLAQTFNLPITTHGAVYQNMHLIAGVDNGWRVEFHARSRSGVIFKNYPKPKAGWVTVLDRPGLGVEPDEDALAEYLVD